MNRALTKKSAQKHIITIGVFYLISGIWEIILGMEYASLDLFLLNLRREYVMLIGLLSIVVGFGLLNKNNICRILALILAWWNLFTVPFIDIWLSIYTIQIKKISTVYSWLNFWLWTIGILAAVTAVRIYIIYMLKVSKAGYIFLKREG